MLAISYFYCIYKMLSNHCSTPLKHLNVSVSINYAKKIRQITNKKMLKPLNHAFAVPQYLVVDREGGQVIDDVVFNMYGKVKVMLQAALLSGVYFLYPSVVGFLFNLQTHSC
ncbi:hypothetical protein XELAEV_18009307mg [Xenopus laevis]|uniref:Uncharacterized protein n=1 Tax=Xenopus laevis TaxID=8355 RepID=A0A974I0F6_XENLA|nr:hypothetical protein XELAEV_18009307mg [Xenopus laevis]